MLLVGDFFNFLFMVVVYEVLKAKVFDNEFVVNFYGGDEGSANRIKSCMDITSNKVGMSIP